MESKTELHRHSTLLSRFSKHLNVHDTTRNTIDIPEFQPLRATSGDIQSPENETLFTKSEWILSEPGFRRPVCPTAWISQVCRAIWAQLDNTDQAKLCKSGFVSSGNQLVKTLITTAKRTDRMLANGVWQLLLEEGAIQLCDKSGDPSPLSNETDYVEFKDSTDKYYYCSCPKIERPPEQETDELNPDEFDTSNSKDKLESLIDHIYRLATDAVLRRILFKPKNERTVGELEFVFTELSLIPCFAQLPTSVRSELSKCLLYEIHPRAGRALFRQGDQGTCWYVIQKGSVWVHVKGQGYVCRLGEGDDFGKLALVTGAPRAATIVLAEDNCHFLRTDKVDSDRILADVERNIVRLREVDSDVLILERLPVSKNEQLGVDAESKSEEKHTMEYVISAGTFEKMLQHILDVRLKRWVNHMNVLYDRLRVSVHLCPQALEESEGIIEDFCLTLRQFSTHKDLFECLFSYSLYGTARKQDFTDLQVHTPDEKQSVYIKRVIAFVYFWLRCIGLWHFTKVAGLEEFLSAINRLLSKNSNLVVEHKMVTQILGEAFTARQHSDPSTVNESSRQKRSIMNQAKNPKSKVTTGVMPLFIFPKFTDLSEPRSSMKRAISWEEIHLNPTTNIPFLVRLGLRPATLPLSETFHTVEFLVYVESSKQPTSIKLPINYSVNDIKAKVSGGSVNPDICVLELMSKGEQIIFQETDRNISLSIHPNSCLFVVSKESAKKLTPLPCQLRHVMNFLERTEPSYRSIEHKDYKHSQSGLRRTSSTTACMKCVEELNPEMLAAILTSTTSKIALCIGAEELLDYTLGCARTGRGTPHVRLLISHFTFIYSWTITQIITCQSINKRVNTLKKFIRLANCLINPPFNDQLNCFAILLGMQSGPVTRLTQTWDRVPVKYRRIHENILSPLVDPSRNHRSARQWIENNRSACLPFLPIILKDLRFAEDANKSHYKSDEKSISLVNFEKMRLFAKSLRVWNHAVSGYETLHPWIRTRRTKITTSTTPEAVMLTKLINEIPPGTLETFYTSLECVDDPRMLLQLSLRVEPKK